MWWFLFSVSLTKDTFIDFTVTGKTSFFITRNTNLTNFSGSIWAGTIWWIVSSTFGTVDTIVSFEGTGDTLDITIETNSFRFVKTFWTWTNWWVLGSLWLTGFTFESVFTGCAMIFTWLTFYVVHVIVETVWTDTVWDTDSVCSTLHTVIGSFLTTDTSEVTVFADSINLGLTFWTVTVWWIVHSALVTGDTLIFVINTS